MQTARAGAVTMIRNPQVRDRGYQKSRKVQKLGISRFHRIEW